MNVLALAAVLLLATPVSGAKIIRQIELRGDARMLSMDEPVRRGRLYLFHRYPDGVYMSVPATDVIGIATTRVDDRPKAGDTVVLGPTGEGRPAAAAGSHAELASGASGDESADGGYYYGYDGCYGCYGGTRPLPPRPAPAPPALVGSNGFPLMPGSPAPLPIGPNGFPIISPPQKQPQPH